MMSGLAVTTCSSALRLWFCLNSKSPKALERAKLPASRGKRISFMLHACTGPKGKDRERRTIHSTELNEAAGCDNAGVLAFIDGLVVV